MSMLDAAISYCGALHDTFLAGSWSHDGRGIVQASMYIKLPALHVLQCDAVSTCCGLMPQTVHEWVVGMCHVNCYCLCFQLTLPAAHTIVDNSSLSDVAL